MKEFARGLNELDRPTIIDVGCDTKPYRSYFNLDVKYIGIDLSLAVKPEVLGGVDALPFRDGVADAVICTQVIEHVSSPEKLLLEVSRILKPGGRLFLSTHGSYVYHPYPGDYWRWTHQGMRLLCDSAPDLTFDCAKHCGGSVSSLGALTCIVLDQIARRNTIAHLLRPIIVPIINVVCGLAEKVSSKESPDDFGVLISTYVFLLTK